MRKYSSDSSYFNSPDPTDCDSFAHGAPLIEDNNRNVLVLFVIIIIR